MECIKKGVEFYANVPGNTCKPPRTQIQVKCMKPNPDWVKLNTDGAVFGVPIKASRGGLLRCNDIGLQALLENLARCLASWRSFGLSRMACHWLNI